jgi:xanthine dehydrogenase accessory factor
VAGDVFEALATARRAGRPVVLATTVRTEGDPPSAPGNRALFAADGALLAGTVGCNGLDRRAGRDGRALLAAGERAGVRRYTSFEDDPDAAERPGAQPERLRGEVEVFLEVFPAERRLLVGGSGPVADAIGRIGEVIGLAVRAEPPGSAAFAGAAADLTAGDAVVFVDHDDPDLLPALTLALDGQAGYVGVMGSRRHTPGFVARLREQGTDLARLHSPTGLDLGARTPGEIALSILAEVLVVTRGRDARSLDIAGQHPPAARVAP